MNIYDYELQNIQSLEEAEYFEDELQIMEANRKLNNRRRKQFRLERESNGADLYHHQKADATRLRRE